MRPESLGKLKEEQLKVGPKWALHRGRCKSTSNRRLARRVREWERPNQMTLMRTTKHRERCAVDCRKAARRVRREGSSESNEAEAQGCAGTSQAALPNQTLWQASLPQRLFLNRSTRLASAPCFLPANQSPATRYSAEGAFPHVFTDIFSCDTGPLK